jgi:hypothetical protein
MYVFLQAYEPGVPAAPAATAPPLGVSNASVAAPGPAVPSTKPLIAFVSFYQGQNKVLETQPLEVTPNPNTRLQIAPVNFTVDLSQLTPGKYDCQVTVLDPMGQKGAFWQAPIMLVQ